MFTGSTSFTGITSHAGVLVTTLVLLSGTATLRGGTAAADSNQDDRFLALLDKQGIPALEGVPNLIDTAHKVCRVLDAGIPADRVVDAMVNNAYSVDPAERRYAPGRLARTEARFITAAVGAYCPYEHSRIAFIVTDPASHWNDPTHRVADDIRDAVNSGDDLRALHMLPGGALATDRSGGDGSNFDVHGAAFAALTAAVPAGQVNHPDPPQLPPPSPPLAHLQAPRRPIAAPPRPRQVPPPPKKPPPPPAVAPQPGAASGSGGSGSNGGGHGSGGSSGGGLPAAPPAPPVPPAPPAPPSDPGFVRLAP